MKRHLRRPSQGAMCSFAAREINSHSADRTQPPCLAFFLFLLLCRLNSFQVPPSKLLSLHFPFCLPFNHPLSPGFRQSLRFTYFVTSTIASERTHQARDRCLAPVSTRRHDTIEIPCLSWPVNAVSIVVRTSPECANCNIARNGCPSSAR
jgi:hypothetical protein